MEIAVYFDRLVILFVIGSFILSPVIINWRSDELIVWYKPFVVWIVLIGLAFWVARSRDINDL